MSTDIRLTEAQAAMLRRAGGGGSLMAFGAAYRVCEALTKVSLLRRVSYRVYHITNVGESWLESHPERVRRDDAGGGR